MVLALPDSVEPHRQLFAGDLNQTIAAGDLIGWRQAESYPKRAIKKVLRRRGVFWWSTNSKMLTAKTADSALSPLKTNQER